MAREVNEIWVSDMFHRRIRKVRETGNEIKSFYNSDNTVRDLAWDGEYIWAMNTAGTLKKYTPDGVVTDTIGGLLDGGWGLTFENGYLWASNPTNNRIYQIALDSKPPDAPIGLEATPAGWTQVNFFTIDWINPSDTSGIAGAYYKLGTSPTSNNDGTYTTVKPFFVSASSQGGELLYVWLMDNMNNVDYTAYSVDTLFYDRTGPASGTITINNGDSLTVSRTVTLSNISAIDSFSGMGEESQMMFSNDGSIWSPAEDCDSMRAEWDLVGYGGSDTPGMKRVYAVVSDIVGNWSQPFSDEIYYAPPLSIETTVLPDGSVGVPYHHTLTAHGGRVPYAWNLQSGSLPDGLDMSSEGFIVGIPEATGTFPFTVAVVDSVDDMVAADLSIHIHEAQKADVNGDGKINIVDVITVVNNILDIVEFTPVQVWAADMNEDGQVNILDTAGIIQIILGPARRSMGRTHN